MFLVEKTFKMPITMGHTTEELAPRLAAANLSAIIATGLPQSETIAKDTVDAYFQGLREARKLIYTSQNLFVVDDGRTAVIRAVALWVDKESYLEARQKTIGLPVGIMEDELDLLPYGIDATVIYEEIATGK